MSNCYNYTINNENVGLDSSDFETIYSLCTEFLQDYYLDITNENEIVEEKYVNNKNLINYINQLIEVQRYPTSSQVKETLYGLNDLEWHLEQQYVYVSINADVLMDYGGGFAEGHTFLIQNQNTQLVIVDWYSPGKVGSGTFDKHRVQEERINDPTIWDNEDWVQDFFKRAHIEVS